MPLRQATGMMASLLKLAGLDWPVPDFSTLCHRQKTLTVHIPYRPGTGALHLLIDSPGIKAEGDGEWLAKKHGPSKPREWRKVHLGIDAETLEIRAIEITGSRIGDAPMLPDLLNQIPADQPLGRVTADGAYDTRRCHAALADRGAVAVRRANRPWTVSRSASPRRARTAYRGRNKRQEPRPATRPCEVAAVLVGRSGGTGRTTPDEAGSKPKCAASNYWARASCHATSTARSPSFRSGQPS